MVSAWRAGRRVPEHLYRDDEPVATMAAEHVAEVLGAFEVVRLVRALHCREDGPNGPTCAECRASGSGDLVEWPCETWITTHHPTRGSWNP